MATFNVFVDGSSYGDTNRHGIGFVIVNGNPAKPSEHSKRLDLPGRIDSSLAEVHAAAAAIEHISAPAGSTVILHTDFAKLAQTINFPQTAGKIRRRRPDIKAAYTRLFNAAVAKDLTIQAVHTPETSDPFMLRAHNLAQQGADMARPERPRPPKGIRRREKYTAIEDSLRLAM